jgi:hypothetical protein
LISVIGVFVGFSRIFLQGILIFERLTARHHYNSFGVKGLMNELTAASYPKYDCSRQFLQLLASSFFGP